MTSLIGRRVTAVLGGTALAAAVVAGTAGVASAHPGPALPAPGPGVIQVDPVPGRPAAPAPGGRIMIDPVGPGEPIVCLPFDDDGQVIVTTPEGDGPWVTIERATPADTVPATPIDIVPATPIEPGCVTALVR